MIMKIVDAEISVSPMQAKTILRDDFGTTFIVQTSLTDPAANHATDVATATATLQANQDTFVEHLRVMGKTDEQIDKMKVQ